MDSESTIFFKVEKEKNENFKQILRQVYDAMAKSDKGYDPISQIVGYILSGDPTYITSEKNARGLIRQVERDELLEELVKDYIGVNEWEKEQ
ncbi:MAG: IreB family regulatory phosphoprotein [Clostridia bacterium]|nr:IreB family regulatory phosphoprotein [Clostridia bacterium]